MTKAKLMIDLSKIKLGMTRSEVIEILGQPSDTEATTKKHRTPCIFKYGEIEFHFETHKSGGLFLVYTEDQDGNGISLMGPWDRSK